MKMPKQLGFTHWGVDSESTVLIDKDGDDPVEIAEVTDEHRDHDGVAAELVRRWNMHDELVACCEAALERLEHEREHDLKSGMFNPEEGDELFNALQTVLAH